MTIYYFNPIMPDNEEKEPEVHEIEDGYFYVKNGIFNYVSKDQDEKRRFSLSVDGVIKILDKNITERMRKDGIQYWDTENNCPVKSAAEYGKMGERQLIKQCTAETSLICAQHYNSKVSCILGDKTLPDSEKIKAIRADKEELRKECLVIMKKIYKYLPKPDSVSVPS